MAHTQAILAHAQQSFLHIIFYNEKVWLLTHLHIWKRAFLFAATSSWQLGRKCCVTNWQMIWPLKCPESPHINHDTCCIELSDLTFIPVRLAICRGLRFLTTEQLCFGSNGATIFDCRIWEYKLPNNRMYPTKPYRTNIMQRFPRFKYYILF